MFRLGCLRTMKMRQRRARSDAPYLATSMGETPAMEEGGAEVALNTRRGSL